MLLSRARLGFAVGVESEAEHGTRGRRARIGVGGGTRRGGSRGPPRRGQLA